MTPVHAIVENVSRRGFLKGIITTGSLVVAGQFLPARAALAYPTGADKMPHGVRSDPHLFVSIAPDGTVQGVFVGYSLTLREDLTSCIRGLQNPKIQREL